MFYSISLSYKKIDKDVYAYYPISPLVPRAYLINKADKERLEALAASKMIFLISSVPAYSLGAIASKMYGIVAAICTMLCAISFFRWKRMLVLRSYHLQHYPRIDFIQYYSSLGRAMTWKDIRGAIVGALLALFFAWWIYSRNVITEWKLFIVYPLAIFGFFGLFATLMLSGLKLKLRKTGK